MAESELIRFLNEDGWAIKKVDFPIDAIRNYWIKAFSTPPQPRNIWSPYRGQPNSIGYSCDSFQKMYRAADFLWDHPFHLDTRSFGLEIEKFKLSTFSLPPEQFYISVNRYPPNGGFLAEHTDGLEKGRLVLALVPLTFIGIHFQSGGLYLYDRHGRKLYIEDMVSPGDVLFYDGSLRHGVEPVYGGIGRLQMHPIPCQFKLIDDNLPALSQIPLTNYVKAKLLGLEHAVRIKMGMSLRWR